MPVREHFEAEHNAVNGQEMNVLSPVLAFAAKPAHRQPQAGLHSSNRLSEQANLISRFNIDFYIQFTQAHAFCGIG
jgi:hypothetical protein